jgi:membrane-bound lytic murein transglycosylase B
MRLARAVRAWSRGPNGQLTLPALLLLALVTATGVAGYVLIPVTARAPRPPAADVTVAVTATSGVPDLAQPAPTAPALTFGPTRSPAPTPPVTVARGRPGDVLAAWAQQTGAKVGVPPIAMQAYGYAELVLAQTTPACHLTWTTLAAIGYVESNHGSANGATLRADGQSVPPIIGDPLDGKGGRQLVLDTDRGQLDGDTTYDRAIGPMQFIPSTWRTYGVDADNDGVKNPQNINDAALAAANYLCSGGRNLSTAAGWWSAILSYNNVQPYAQKVFDTANRYGTASRT